MLNIIPELLPDELFYGWCIRYHMHSGNINIRSTIKELLGKGNIHKLNLCFPVNLEWFVKQLPKGFGFTCDYIINNHTIFPFLKVFMDKTNVNKAIDRMIHDTNKGIMKIPGVNVQHIFNIDILKICPQCIIEDIRNYGEAYFHRSHQVPGNLICTKHLQYLKEIDSKESINIYNYNVKYSDINEKITKEELDFSQEIDKILNGEFENLSIDTIKEKYIKKLKEEEYIKNYQVNQVQLSNDFLKYYSLEFLNKMNSTINVYDTLEKSWIKRISIDYSNIYATRHILFIKFLFGGIMELDSYCGDGNPFGIGPWPCLNPAAAHYLEEVVYECLLNKNKKVTIGKFKCSCGFIYTRKIKSDKLDLCKVIQFGEVWEEKLLELYKSGKYTNKQMAEIMKCSKGTICKYLKKLNGLVPNKTRDNVIGSSIDKIDEAKVIKLDKYKKRISEYILRNRNESRKEIQNSLKCEYIYVFKYDRAWMEDILPNPQKPIAGQRKNWKTEDDRLLFLVKRAVKEIIEYDKLVRITVTEVSRIIRYRQLSINLTCDKLPRTKEYLEQKLESLEEFHKRKVKRIIEQLKIEGVNVTSNKVKKKMNLKNDEYSKIKPYIEQCINELC